MMMRSSSTPHLDSLLISSSPSPSIPPSPRNGILAGVAAFPRSFSPVHAAGCFQNCSPLAQDIRRTLSAGNLLSDQAPGVPSPAAKRAAAPCLSASSSFRRLHPGAESSPCFSAYGPELVEEDEAEYKEEDDDEEDQEQENEAEAEEGEGDGEKQSIEERERLVLEDSAAGFPPLFLARGLGIDRVASGFFDREGDGSGSGGGVLSDEEKHHRRMVEENPRDALFLRNYGQFLYQKKGDHRRAEEYYSRAILADPSDGEVLSQYARIVWELHGDEERASSYFQQAVQANPEDSHVLAAYAEFLWETEEDDSEGCKPLDYSVGSPHLAGPIERSCYV